MAPSEMFFISQIPRPGSAHFQYSSLLPSLAIDTTTMYKPSSLPALLALALAIRPAFTSPLTPRETQECVNGWYCGSWDGFPAVVSLPSSNFLATYLPMNYTPPSSKQSL